jgi:predicted PurR-regulated permease PerM
MSERQPLYEPDSHLEPSANHPSSSDVPGLIQQLTDWFDGSIKLRSVALTGLFLYSSFWVIYVAKAILLPIVVALIFTLLLAPLMRALKKIWIPAPLAAGGILLVVVMLFAIGLVQLATPASLWLDRAPEALQQVERKFRTVKHSVSEMGKATKALEKVTSLPETTQAPEVKVRTTSLGGLLLGWTTEVMLGWISTLILLYFFLASGDLFLEKLVKVLPRFEEKRRAVEIVRDIEANISGYLLTVTGINISLALVVSLAMYLWGMPNPFLWGAMAGILNFIPYLGSLIGLGAITLAAILTYEQLSMVAMVSGTYLLLTGLEGNFLTPQVLGRKLTLNPVVILVSVLLWGWLWGTSGVLLAVPLVASFKIICDQIESLYPIAEFLGR